MYTLDAARFGGLAHETRVLAPEKGENPVVANADRTTLSESDLDRVVVERTIRSGVEVYRRSPAAAH